MRESIAYVRELKADVRMISPRVNKDVKTTKHRVPPKSDCFPLTESDFLLSTEATLSKCLFYWEDNLTTEIGSVANYNPSKYGVCNSGSLWCQTKWPLLEANISFNCIE